MYFEKKLELFVYIRNHLWKTLPIFKQLLIKMKFEILEIHIWKSAGSN